MRGVGRPPRGQCGVGGLGPPAAVWARGFRGGGGGGGGGGPPPRVGGGGGGGGPHPPAAVWARGVRRLVDTLRSDRN